MKLRVDNWSTENSDVSTILLDNHTECEYACPRNATFCRANETWNDDMCSCCARRDDQVCENSRWSEDYCACVPYAKVEVEELPIVDEPPEESGVRVKFVILIMVGESIALCSLCFVVFRFCCSERLLRLKRSRGRRKQQQRQQEGDGDGAGEEEGIRLNDVDSVSTRSSTVAVNNNGLVNNRDSFTYNVDKEQRKFVVNGGHGSFTKK